MNKMKLCKSDDGVTKLMKVFWLENINYERLAARFGRQVVAWAEAMFFNL
jgi:hypothetical protein